MVQPMRDTPKGGQPLRKAIVTMKKSIIAVDDEFKKTIISPAKQKTL
jgi:hypothetical protein